MQQPVGANKLFFWRNGCWKHFGDKSVKNQTSIYATFDKVSQNTLCVYSTNQYWLVSSSCTPLLVLRQTSDQNSQYCKFLTFCSCMEVFKYWLPVWRIAYTLLWWTVWPISVGDIHARFQLAFKSKRTTTTAWKLPTWICISALRQPLR